MAALDLHNWVPLLQPIVKTMNNTTFDAKDPRRELTPMQITKFSAKEQKKLFFDVRDNKRKRSEKLPK